MTRHTKAYLEKKYETPDPWGYQATAEDRARRLRIVRAAKYGAKKPFPTHDRALDIGAGEGWITWRLPAREIHGIELSDNAASRFPPKVKRVHEPDGLYDLVVATGVFYDHYDLERLHTWAVTACRKTLVTCHIRQHEREPPGLLATRVEVFPYQDKDQVLRVYDLSAA